MNQIQLEDAKFLLTGFDKIQTNRSARPIIAGGCLRDLIMGRPVKDIDLIVCDNMRYKNTNVLEAFCRLLGYTQKDKTSKSQYYNQKNQLGTHKQITRVIELNKVGCLPIDVIFVTNAPLERLRMFPCNGSMIHLDMLNPDLIVPTVEFNLFRKGDLHFYNTCLPEYRTRMVEYFPAHKVVVDLSEEVKVERISLSDITDSLFSNFTTVEKLFN